MTRNPDPGEHMPFENQLSLATALIAMSPSGGIASMIFSLDTPPRANMALFSCGEIEMPAPVFHTDALDRYKQKELDMLPCYIDTSEAPYGRCPDCNTPLPNNGSLMRGDLIEDSYPWCHKCDKRVPHERVVYRMEKPDMASRKSFTTRVQVDLTPELKKAFDKAKKDKKSARAMRTTAIVLIILSAIFCAVGVITTVG